MRCDEWGCGKTYDTHRQQWIPELACAACGALAHPSLHSFLREAAKTADADKKRTADVACADMTIAEPHTKRLKDGGKSVKFRVE